MPVRTRHEREDMEPGEPYELPDACVLCSTLTRYWWGQGCVPICPTCSALPSTTHAAMLTLARREGYGPLPTENTDIIPGT